MRYLYKIVIMISMVSVLAGCPGDDRSVCNTKGISSGIAYDQPDAIGTVNEDSCEIVGNIALYDNPVQQIKSSRIDVCVDETEYLRSAKGVITGMITSFTLNNNQSVDDLSGLITTARQETDGILFNFRSFGLVIDSRGISIDPLNTQYINKSIFELLTVENSYSTAYRCDPRQLNAMTNGGMPVLLG